MVKMIDVPCSLGWSVRKLADSCVFVIVPCAVLYNDDWPVLLAELKPHLADSRLRWVLDLRHSDDRGDHEIIGPTVQQAKDYGVFGADVAILSDNPFEEVHSRMISEVAAVHDYEINIRHFDDVEKGLEWLISLENKQ